MQDVFDYIRRLIDIPSVSGSEHEISFFLERDLRQKGFSVVLQEVTANRSNVYATHDGFPAKVILCTHIDTVPPFIPSSEDGQHIYGRGSCDAKGIIGSMIWAALALKNAGIKEIGLLFVVGEEVDSIGANVANALPSVANYVIVGEPTENLLASGHKGGFKFRLTATGKAAHSAYPELGDSAIHRLIALVSELQKLDWGWDELLESATINIGTIEGGVAANVFAPSATADVFVRVVGKVIDVEDKLKMVLSRHPQITYEIITSADAVYCETVPGFDIQPVSFGTDIPALKTFGKAILIGPGSIHDAHTDGEKIRKDDVVAAIKYYQLIVKSLIERLD